MSLLPALNSPTLRAFAVVLLALMFPFSMAAAAQVFKCTIGGTVTYQASPCPSGQARQIPTLEQLNTEKQKKLKQPVGSVLTQTLVTASGRSCDGRTVCSQMTSCAEAKYFLANCPGVKLDGDRDGKPCEQQWCSK